MVSRASLESKHSPEMDFPPHGRPTVASDPSHPLNDVVQRCLFLFRGEVEGGVWDDDGGPGLSVALPSRMRLMPPPSAESNDGGEPVPVIPQRRDQVWPLPKELIWKVLMIPGITERDIACLGATQHAWREAVRELAPACFRDPYLQTLEPLIDAFGFQDPAVAHAFQQVLAMLLKEELNQKFPILPDELLAELDKRGMDSGRKLTEIEQRVVGAIVSALVIIRGPGEHANNSPCRFDSGQGLEEFPISKQSQALQWVIIDNAPKQFAIPLAHALKCYHYFSMSAKKPHIRSANELHAFRENNFLLDQILMMRLYRPDSNFWDTRESILSYKQKCISNFVNQGSHLDWIFVKTGAETCTRVINRRGVENACIAHNLPWIPEIFRGETPPKIWSLLDRTQLIPNHGLTGLRSFKRHGFSNNFLFSSVMDCLFKEGCLGKILSLLPEIDKEDFTSIFLNLNTCLDYFNDQDLSAFLNTIAHSDRMYLVKRIIADCMKKKSSNIDRLSFAKRAVTHLTDEQAMSVLNDVRQWIPRGHLMKKEIVLLCKGVPGLELEQEDAFEPSLKLIVKEANQALRDVENERLKEGATFEDAGVILRKIKKDFSRLFKLMSRLDRYSRYYLDERAITSLKLIYQKYAQVFNQMKGLVTNEEEKDSLKYFWECKREKISHKLQIFIRKLGRERSQTFNATSLTTGLEGTPYASPLSNRSTKMRRRAAAHAHDGGN